MTIKDENKSGITDLLRNTDLFRNLDPAAYDHVLGLVKWKQYRKGSEIFPYRDEGDGFYIIGSGRVKITNFSSSGKEILYQELVSGDTFGELSAIDQLPRSANVVTLEASCIGLLSRNEFWEIIGRYPDIAEAVLKRLAKLVRSLSDRVYQYSALDVKDRVRGEVLRLARENHQEGDTATISNFPTHNQIANRINTHREAVTRELSELTRLGLIEQKQRVMIVTSIARLVELLPEEF